MPLTSNSAGDKKNFLPPLCILFICTFALFWHLGSHGLTEPDEGRTAGIGFEFFQNGTWLVPRLFDLSLIFQSSPLVARVRVGADRFQLQSPCAQRGRQTVYKQFDGFPGLSASTP